MVFLRLLVLVLAISAFLGEAEAAETLMCFTCDAVNCRDEPYSSPPSQLTQCFPYLTAWAGAPLSHGNRAASATSATSASAASTVYNNGSEADSAGTAGRSAAAVRDDDDDDQYVCVKAIFTQWDGDDVSFALRRCATRDSNPCGKLQDQATSFKAKMNYCSVCNRDYCNGGPRHSAASIAAVLVLSLGLLLRS